MKQFLFSLVLTLVVISCSKENDATLSFDGAYEGFLYSAKTRKSSPASLIIKNSASSQMEVRSQTGKKIGFVASRLFEDNNCVYYSMVTNDSMKGVPSSRIAEHQFIFSKGCKCPTFKAKLNRDTITFVPR